MSKIALTYPIPFVSQVTMPGHWARWLSTMAFGLPALRHEAENRDEVTWEYDQHGPAPWMQFFYDWRFSDLTGDGLIDMILTGGANRQIAYRQDGDVLWQYEDPEAGFLDIRLDTNFPLCDLNQDGQTELVCARKIDGHLHLCIVNTQNGEVLKHIPYPDLEHIPKDNRGSIIIADIQGIGHPSDILVSWDYGSIAAFDQNLNLLWKRVLKHEAGRKHVTMGHTPFPYDIDGDGHEEVMAGSCLLDHDGATLWVAEDLPALIRDGHADSVQITQLANDMGPVVLMSTGGYCFNVDGELLWGRDELLHGQALRVGTLRNDIPGRQVVIYEAAGRINSELPDKILVLTHHGELLWEREVIGPDMQEGGFGFWLGDWTGDGFDEVFLNDREKVNILNGYGKVIDTIPGHIIYVFDLIGDSRVEAVVLTGIYPDMQLHVITNDAPNPNPETNTAITYRHTTRNMYNCTRY